MNNQYSQYLPEKFPEKNKEAIETLERVSREWFSGQEVIKWKVIEPNTKFYVHATSWILGLTFGVIGSLSLWYGYCEKGFIEPSILIVWILLMFIVLFLRKFLRYETMPFIVNRKKHKVYFYTGRSRSSEKYGRPFAFPAFRLPENDTDGTYAQMRKELQRAIHTETGWVFRYDRNGCITFENE